MLSKEYLKEVINSPVNKLTILLATELLSLCGQLEAEKLKPVTKVISFDELADAVKHVTGGIRIKFDPEFCKGHQPVPFMNFNSLSRIVEMYRTISFTVKGEHVPVSGETGDRCSPEVYEKGVSACLVDIPREIAEIICRGISAASGCAVDWHYFAGRVHIKAMRFTTAQKPVVVPPRIENIELRQPLEVEDMWRHRFIAAIKAASGTVEGE